MGSQRYRILAGPRAMPLILAEGTAAFNPCAGAVTQGVLEGNASCLLYVRSSGFMAGSLMDLLLCKHLCRASILFMFAFVYKTYDLHTSQMILVKPRYLTNCN